MRDLKDAQCYQTGNCDKLVEKYFFYEITINELDSRFHTGSLLFPANSFQKGISTSSKNYEL